MLNNGLPNINELNRQLDGAEQQILDLINTVKSAVVDTHNQLKQNEIDIETNIFPFLNEISALYNQKKYKFLKDGNNKIVDLIKLYNSVVSDLYENKDFSYYITTEIVRPSIPKVTGGMLYPIMQKQLEEKKTKLIVPRTNFMPKYFDGLGFAPAVAYAIKSLVIDKIMSLPQIQEAIAKAVDFLLTIGLYGYKDLKDRQYNIQVRAEKAQASVESIVNAITKAKSSIDTISKDIVNIITDITNSLSNTNNQPETAETKKEIIPEKVVNTGKYYGRAGEHYEYTSRADIPLIMPMDRKPAVSGYDIAGVYDREITKIKNSINLSHLRRS